MSDVFLISGSGGGSSSFPNMPQPSTNGFLAESKDFGDAGFASLSLTLGVPFFTRIPVNSSITIANVWYIVGTAGTLLTAAQNFVSIYTVSGGVFTQIATTADQSTNFASTGVKSAALTVVGGQSLTQATDLYAVFLANGTGTVPAVSFAGGALAANANQATPRRAGNFALAAQTSLPSPFSGGTNNQPLIVAAVN